MKKKQEFKKLISLLVVVVMLISTTGCATWDNFKAAFIDKVEEKQTIKIGVLEPLTGSDAEAAKPEIMGIELAHQVYPTIENKEVELVYADNASDVQLCPTAAQSLIDAGCSVILGSYKSVLTLAASDVIKAGRVPAIAITNTNPIITQTNPYYFRVCYIDSFEGNVAGQFVYEQLQTTSVAVLLKEGDDYAAAMAAEFISSSETASGEFEYIETVTIPADTTDYGMILLQLNNLSPSAVFFPSTLALAQEVMSISELNGYEFTWVGTSKWDGLEFENVYYTLDYDPQEATTERAETFQRAYKNTYQTSEKPAEAVALGYDAYLLALRGIYDADPDEDLTITKALELVEDMECATGYLTMSSSGDPIKEVIVEKYENGSRSPVYTVLPQKEGREEGETK